MRKREIGGRPRKLGKLPTRQVHTLPLIHKEYQIFLVCLRIDHSDHSQLTMGTLGTIVIDRVCIVNGDDKGASGAGSGRLIVREEAIGGWKTGGIEGSLCNAVVLWDYGVSAPHPVQYITYRDY